jgi:hypothetical protein
MLVGLLGGCWLICQYRVLGVRVVLVENAHQIKELLRIAAKYDRNRI